MCISAGFICYSCDWWFHYGSSSGSWKCTAGDGMQFWKCTIKQQFHHWFWGPALTRRLSPQTPGSVWSMFQFLSNLLCLLAPHNWSYLTQSTHPYTMLKKTRPAMPKLNFGQRLCRRHQQISHNSLQSIRCEAKQWWDTVIALVQSTLCDKKLISLMHYLGGWLILALLKW